MVNNLDSHLVKHSLNGHNSQGITLAQPNTPLLSIPDRSNHHNPAIFTSADNTTIHRDGVAFKHMDELLAKLKFEDTIDDEVQPSPVVKLPWISPLTSKLLNNPKAET
ncbi:hypothetical protein F5051DRAFT_447588 [Lentinula edodes]|nr:hypothetical protein F5051DRAFT_447588 [Lentinula edodes]